MSHATVVKDDGREASALLFDPVQHVDDELGLLQSAVSAVHVPINVMEYSCIRCSKSFPTCQTRKGVIALKTPVDCCHRPFARSQRRVVVENLRRGFKVIEEAPENQAKQRESVTG
jgi:hypothetical protein